MKPSDLEFPVWMIFAVENESATSGAPAFAVEKDRGQCMPIFTDTDLAERFSAAKIKEKGRQHILKELPSLEVLTNVVKHLEKGGCKHVAVDAFIGKGFQNAHFIPVGEFI